MLKAVTPSPRITNIQRRPRYVAAAPSMYDLNVYPAPVLLPRLMYPPPVISDSPLVYQPRRAVPTAKVYPPPFVFLPPPVRRAWIFYDYISRSKILLLKKRKKKKKKNYNNQIATKSFLRKEDFLFVILRRIKHLQLNSILLWGRYPLLLSVLFSGSGLEKFGCNYFWTAIISLLTSREDIHIIILPVIYPILITCA